MDEISSGGPAARLGDTPAAAACRKADWQSRCVLRQEYFRDWDRAAEFRVALGKDFTGK
jgi:hypothetical protein